MNWGLGVGWTGEVVRFWAWCMIALVGIRGHERRKLCVCNLGTPTVSNGGRSQSSKQPSKKEDHY